MLASIEKSYCIKNTDSSLKIHDSKQKKIKFGVIYMLAYRYEKEKLTRKKKKKKRFPKRKHIKERKVG